MRKIFMCVAFAGGWPGGRLDMARVCRCAAGAAVPRAGCPAHQGAPLGEAGVVAGGSRRMADVPCPCVPPCRPAVVAGSPAGRLPDFLRRGRHLGDGGGLWAPPHAPHLLCAAARGGSSLCTGGQGSLLLPALRLVSVALPPDRVRVGMQCLHTCWPLPLLAGGVSFRGTRPHVWSWPAAGAGAGERGEHRVLQRRPTRGRAGGRQAGTSHRHYFWKGELCGPLPTGGMAIAGAHGPACPAASAAACAVCCSLLSSRATLDMLCRCGGRPTCRSGRTSTREPCCPCHAGPGYVHISQEMPRAHASRDARLCPCRQSCHAGARPTSLPCACAACPPQVRHHPAALPAAFQALLCGGDPVWGDQPGQLRLPRVSALASLPPRRRPVPSRMRMCATAAAATRMQPCCSSVSAASRVFTQCYCHLTTPPPSPPPHAASRAPSATLSPTSAT